MVEWKKLGEICYISDYVSNGSFASLRENVQYKSEPDYAILVRFADYSNGFDTSKFVYIDEHAYHFLSKSYLEGGEIIMSNVGSCGLLFRCPKLDRKMSLAPNSILIKSEFIDYLYYWLGGNVGQEEIRKITSKSAMPKFNKTEFKKIQVPIPSLEEQARIVSILDTFTASIDNLKEQIAQRRKQFEYYRDKLLDLEGKEGVEMKTLGETCIIKNGYTPSTKEPSFWENGTLPWFTLEDIRKNGRILKDAIKHITSLGVKRGGLFPKDSIIISTTATIGEYALIKSDFLCNQQITCLTIKEEMKGHLLPKYLYYLSDGIGKWCKSHVNGGGSLLIVSTSKLIGLQVPLPPLSEQQRIVSILDKFEASIQNLEAQLSQREKQYEYYRNKLLTFE